MILGIDEAGRGPWAGPLVVGAVVLGCEIDGLNDSKKLTKKRREALEIEILDKAQATATGWVGASELDELGMSEALCLATRRAVEQIHVPYHEIIIDGTVNFLRDTTKGNYVTTMPKADALVPSVSAASIIAKVARDRYMAEIDARYPGYGFAGHAGYGVAKHRAAIESLGVTPEHRLSFAPLVKYKTEAAIAAPNTPIAATSTRSIGDISEAAAAEYLQADGHEILERNWRTKYCEIDIVSFKDDVYYFVEVKHRRNARAGDGVAAITPKKLNQMKFAVRLYAQHRELHDHNLRLAVISTSGEIPHVDEYIEVKE